MKRVLLLLTGGTIGSRAQGGVVDLGGGAELQMYRGPEPVELIVRRPLEQLSENLHPSDWRTLYAAAQSGGADGIILTHGSDTLAYTAAAMGYLLGGTGLPVALVAANLPPDDPRSNGPANFAAAVSLVVSGAQGVFVPYWNPGDARGSVHLATRIQSARPLEHRFESLPAPVASFSKPPEITPCPRFAGKGGMRRGMPDFGRVLLIAPYPGLDYAQFRLDGVQAVLHTLYHAGTASLREGGSALRFMETCAKRGIPFFLWPGREGEDAYPSRARLERAGARALCTYTPEAAYVKLMLAMGMGEHLLDEELYFETAPGV